MKPFEGRTSCKSGMPSPRPGVGQACYWVVFQRRVRGGRIAFERERERNYGRYTAAAGQYRDEVVLAGCMWGVVLPG